MIEDYEYIPADHLKKFGRSDVIDKPLHVITPVFNPQRFRSRWKHYYNFEKMVSDAGGRLTTVEVAFGQRASVITEPFSENHTVINLRSRQEIWLKENMINIGISRLDPNWEYVAWIDADVQFARPDWVGETLQQLQHYKIVQMFSECHDLNYDAEIIQKHKGFMWCYLNEGLENLGNNPKNSGPRIPAKPKQAYTSDKGDFSYWHPGFAWAARREALEDVGGLIDWSILGGGDTFMAYALVGVLNQRFMPKSLGPSGVRLLQQWEQRAEKYIRRNVGYVKGSIYHYWHGNRKDRGYYDRGTILTKASFDPEKDLYRDSQLLYQINPENILLRDGAQAYFRQRNEDTIN